MKNVYWVGKMECGKIFNIYLYGYFFLNYICSFSKFRCNCMFFGKKKKLKF